MTTPSVPRAFALLPLTLAAALGVNSAVGPLGLELVDYPISGTLHNQLLGLVVVTIALVVPSCAIAGVRALREEPQAATLAFAPAAYALYMFIQYVLGPEYGEYHPVVLFHVAIVILSAGLTLWSWSLMREAEMPERSRRAEKAYAW